MQEAFIQQKDGTPVRIGTDHTTGGLQDFIHTRVLVRVVKAGPLFFVKLIPEKFILCTYHRQPGSCDHCTDQPAVLKIDPFAEDSAHYTQTDGGFCRCVLKMGQKLLPFRFTHGSFLNINIDTFLTVGGAFDITPDVLQHTVRRKKDQIISRFCLDET